MVMQAAIGHFSFIPGHVWKFYKSLGRDVKKAFSIYSKLKIPT